VRGKREIVQFERCQILHHLHILHNLLRWWWLELVTVFATGFRGEHIVGLAQPMSLRLSSSVKYKTSAGIAESMTIETQVLKGVPYFRLSDSPSST
jgi:hypothetical protein